MVAQTRHGGQNSPRRLKFNEKLVNKGLTTDALLKKLKALHDELADMDQELVDIQSLGTVRKELISTSILLHKDRGVKAHAACCMADILRLYAPDAPYTQTELRDIFSFFFRQLVTGLTGPDASYYDEYFHLLESLSTVKSVVLVCDLPQAEELMTTIFRDCFALVKRDLTKKIEMFLVDILVALIDECQTLPGDVLEIIMSQFMDSSAKPDQSVYRLSAQVCNSTADKLQRHVCQYFTDIIVSSSRDEEFEEIQKAHDLIKRLNRSCPALLYSVFPQLEEELRAEDVQLRQIVTQTLGDMFSDKGGADLIKKYPSTWNLWLNRKNDKSAAVRLKFAEAARGLVLNLPDHKDVVEEALSLKLLDPDDKVRAAVCKAYSQIDYEAALHHVSEAQLRTLARRGADKKQNVRAEALGSLGKLYSLAFPEIENNDSAAIRQFSWIPNEILHMMTVGVEVKLEVERVYGEYILPLPNWSGAKGSDSDEVAWTDRLLAVTRYLDDNAIKSFLSLSGLKINRPTPFEHFVQCCVQNNGGVIDEDEEAITKKLATIIQHLSVSFLDPQKATEDLQSFAKMNDRGLYKLLKTCMDMQSDLRALVKAVNEFSKRLEQTSTAIGPTMLTFLRRATLRYINQSSVPTLIYRAKKGQGDFAGQRASMLLAFISKHCPALYKPHMGQLLKAVGNETHPTVVAVCLQALSALVKWDPKLVAWDKRTAEKIVDYASGSNRRHAKFASRLLAVSNNHDEKCARVLENIVDSLPEANPEEQAAHVAALGQIARFAPDVFESKSDVIMAFLLKEILMVPIHRDPDTMDSEEDWYEGDRVPPEVVAKLYCLKVCRNRCLAMSGSDVASDIAKPVLKMLLTILANKGSFDVNVDEDPRVKSRLMLQAAVSLLHLATVPAYATAIASKLMALALTVQHPVYQVRITFLTKSISLLTPRKLPPRYNVIPLLTVHDPESDIKNTAVAYVNHVLRTLPAATRVEHLEAIFVRLLHALAHHPDFGLTHDRLVDTAKDIDFYLDLVASADNVSLLYHLASKTKTVRDAESPSQSENIYSISELAQELIKLRAFAHGWSIQTHPGKVKMPSDIMKPLPSAEVANKILKTVYLPDDTIAWLADRAKAKAGAGARAKKLEKKVTVSKRKAAPKRNSDGVRRSRVTKSSQVQESGEENLSVTEGSDVEMSHPKRQRADVSSEPEESDGGDHKDKEKRSIRGARTRAKTRIRMQAKAAAKNENDSDD